MLRCHCIYKKITFRMQHIYQQKTGIKTVRKSRNNNAYPGAAEHSSISTLSPVDQINYRGDCKITVFWYDHLNMLAIHQILDLDSK